MSSRLSVHNLTAAYDAPGSGTLAALGPISFTIETGEFVCLIGPSGCGKSTLIRILAGLQRPTLGQAFLNDTSILAPSSQISLMFQDATLMPWRTVLDNIALPLEMAGVARDERYRRVYAMLPTLGLTEFALAYPAELSGGMAQRVALGRVLIQKPDVLLLDEPFGALDALTREQISFDLLEAWARERETVLMVTHDIREAVLLADHVMVMSRRPGRLISDIPVPLPRPRRLEDAFSDAFRTAAREVRAAIDRA
jgi:NitT/TauT family transport system ATP-binding protein